MLEAARLLLLEGEQRSISQEQAAWSPEWDRTLASVRVQRGPCVSEADTREDDEEILPRLFIDNTPVAHPGPLPRAAPKPEAVEAGTEREGCVVPAGTCWTSLSAGNRFVVTKTQNRPGHVPPAPVSLSPSSVTAHFCLQTVLPARLGGRSSNHIPSGHRASSSQPPCLVAPRTFSWTRSWPEVSRASPQPVTAEGSGASVPCQPPAGWVTPKLVLHTVSQDFPEASSLFPRCELP